MPKQDDMLAGWSMFERQANGGHDNMTPEQAAEADRRMMAEYELNVAIRNTFNTADGQIVYEWMREIFTEGARFSLDEVDPDRAAAIGFFREGQAVFYSEVKNRIKRAEQGPPQLSTDQQKGDA